MKCNVKFDNGEGGVFTADGSLEYEEGGFALSYTLDGDKCELRYDGKTLSQTRRGSLCLSMTFSEGEKTQCELSDGELSGSFPLTTEKLSVTATERGVEIYISYYCSGEITRLKISAKN